MSKVVSLFEGKPELRSSYGNQRGLAARDFPGIKCSHGVAISEFCGRCRASGCVLVTADVKGSL